MFIVVQKRTFFGIMRKIKNVHAESGPFSSMFAMMLCIISQVFSENKLESKAFSRHCKTFTGSTSESVLLLTFWGNPAKLLTTMFVIKISSSVYNKILKEEGLLEGLGKFITSAVNLQYCPYRPVL